MNRPTDLITASPEFRFRNKFIAPVVGCGIILFLAEFAQAGSETYEAQARLFESIVSAVAKTCERANSRFDYRRFEKASGLAAIHDRRNLRDAIETDKGAEPLF